MRPVEIIAFLVAALGTVKLLVVLVKPSAWGSVVKSTYGKPSVTIPVGLVLAVIVLNFLLQEITIVQVFASMGFMMCIMMVGVSYFGEEITALSQKLLGDRAFIKKIWPITAIWIALFIWVFYEIFS